MAETKAIPMIIRVRQMSLRNLTVYTDTLMHISTKFMTSVKLFNVKRDIFIVRWDILLKRMRL